MREIRCFRFGDGENKCIASLCPRTDARSPTSLHSAFCRRGRKSAASLGPGGIATRTDVHLPINSVFSDSRGRLGSRTGRTSTRGEGRYRIRQVFGVGSLLVASESLRTFDRINSNRGHPRNRFGLDGPEKAEITFGSLQECGVPDRPSRYVCAGY